MKTADFETTTNPADCRVWAWGIEDVQTKDFEYGNTLDGFMSKLKENGHETYYFHNLKFDGDFIISWLFKHGFKHSEQHKLYPNEFSTLISDKGNFYKLSICYRDKKGKPFQVHMHDSLKLIPFSVEKIANDFNLDVLKGSIDYDVYRKYGHQLTEEEVSYLHNDVDIMAKALEIFAKQGLDGLTIGSNALNFYKKQVTKQKFNRRFPKVSYDRDIRKCYKGGWTYLKDGYSGKIVRDGIVLDVNSLYPWVMANCPLPYGEGKYFEGKYKDDKLYDLYVQNISCEFKLKECYLPTIQMKHSSMFSATEYLKDSDGETVTLSLTNVDLAIFLEHYEVFNIEYKGGWKFRSSKKMFKEYVDYWMDIKINAEKEGNMALRSIAKLYLNNLYGKFAKNPYQASKIPYYKDQIVRYRTTPPEEGEGVYIPVGAFVTAWARDKTIRAAQKNYDRFVYADTDSLHLLGTDIPDGLDIDQYRLGAWKLESRFRKAKFLRAKCYVEDMLQKDGSFKLETKVAGLPKKARNEITLRNFKIGASYTGKVRNKRVDGGIVLVSTPFCIKND